MTDENRLRVGLANVCAHLDELREVLPEHGKAVLARLMSADDGQKVGELLDELDAIMRQEGDVRGVYGGADRGLTVHGLGPVPSEIVYLCPTRRCARYVWHQDAPEAPVCTITGSQLLRERLP